MWPHAYRHENQPRTPPRTAWARVGRLTGVLAAIACGLLASAAIVPAGFAMQVPGGGATWAWHKLQAGTGSVPGQPITVRVITVAGMAGWQITFIALGAALVAAAAAVLLDRALLARRAAAAATT